MKQAKLKKILSEHYDSEHTIKSILGGMRRPNYDVMFSINEKYNIPFKVWKDIKSFINNGSIANNGTTSVSSAITHKESLQKNKIKVSNNGVIHE